MNWNLSVNFFPFYALTFPHPNLSPHLPRTLCTPLIENCDHFLEYELNQIPFEKSTALKYITWGQIRLKYYTLLLHVG
jgi:hypothetical protein